MSVPVIGLNGRPLMPTTERKARINKRFFTCRVSYQRYMIISVILLMLFTFSGCLVRGIKADDWLISKYDSLINIKDFLGELDDAVTLYLTSAIDTDSYLKQIQILENNFITLKQSELEEKIQPGSFDEITMAAKEGYDDIWNSIGQLLESLQKDEDIIISKDALSYVYLAYQEKLKDDFILFAKGYNDAVERSESFGS